MKHPSVRMNITGLLLALCLWNFTPLSASGSGMSSTTVLSSYSRNKTARIDTVAGIRFLQQFYAAYIANELSYEPEESIQKRMYFVRDSLEKTALTKEFARKLDRIETVTEVCGFCHTQEYDEEWKETLHVYPIEGNWYRVTFWCHGLGKRIVSETAVFLTDREGPLRIDYVTPLWHKSGFKHTPLYGDSLFYERPLPVRIDNRSPEAFLLSFYKAYTMGYTALQVDLDAYIAALRKKYLLPEAMNALQKEAEYWKGDGRSGYDLLIGGFIFDRLWEKDLKFVPQAEDLSYKLSCSWADNGSGIPYIVLKLVRQGSSYRIERIVTGFDRYR